MTAQADAAERLEAAARRWRRWYDRNRAAANERRRWRYRRDKLLAAQAEVKVAWLPVPGWPGVEASTKGRVRYVGSEIALEPRREKGSLVVKAHDAEEHRRSVSVARLVALAFHGPAPEGAKVAYRKGRSTRPENLRWEVS